MSFDSFKSSTVGPEALAARLELEKKLREQRERDRALRQRDKERREYNLAIAAEDSKNYEASEGSGEAGSNFAIPKLSRSQNGASAVDQKYQIASAGKPGSAPGATTANGFRLKRF